MTDRRHKRGRKKDTQRTDGCWIGCCFAAQTWRRVDGMSTRSQTQETGSCDNQPCNLGCNMVLYRNKDDRIGFHADDSRNEDCIFCAIAVQGTAVRPLRVQVKRKPKKGDERLELNIRVGDAYSMDGKRYTNRTVLPHMLSHLVSSTL